MELSLNEKRYKINKYFKKYLNKKDTFNKGTSFNKPLLNPKTGKILSIGDLHVLNNLLFLTLCVLVFSFFSLHSYADSINGVSDIFNMEAFIGNTKWFEKWNFVGQIIQGGISIGGFVAAVVVAGQLLITVIYFSSPNLWDNVYEIKQSKKGLISYTASIFPTSRDKLVGNISNGSDIIIDYLILCAPNIKKYSANANDEYESAGTWFMSTFFKHVILLLTISMMLNGSFMKLYTVVVDGLGVVAERYVEVDSKAMVNKLLNTGSNYEFTLGATGKGIDYVQGELATKIYREIIKTSNSVDTDSKYTIGSQIEKYVKSNFTEKSMRDKLIGVAADYKMTDTDWERVSVKVVLNGSPTSTNGFDISASAIGLNDATSSSQKRYLHVYLQAGRAVDTTKYFSVPGASNQ